MKKSVRFEHGVDYDYEQPPRTSKKRKQHEHDIDPDTDDHHNKRTKNAWAAEDTDDMDSDESYTPPANFSLTPVSSPTIYHADHFDDSKELWLMRVPDHIPSQALDGIKLKISTSNGPTKPVATLDYEQYKFSVRESGSGFADEMSQLSCLLEQQSTAGRLVPAPYPFARFFSVTETVDMPTPPNSS